MARLWRRPIVPDRGVRAFRPRQGSFNYDGVGRSGFGTLRGSWVREKGRSGGIAYVFEAGDAYHGEADDLMSHAANVDRVRDAYQYRSHGFVAKQDAVPLQAADLLAWEWGKYFDETVVDRKRGMRLSLVNLLKDNTDRYKLVPLGGQTFLEFFRSVEQLGLEQLQEDSSAESKVEPFTPRFTEKEES